MRYASVSDTQKQMNYDGNVTRKVRQDGKPPTWRTTNTHMQKTKDYRGEGGFLHMGLPRQTDRPLVELPGDSGPGWN